MKLTSEIVKKAWDCRRSAAKKLNCKVMEICWSYCLKKAIRFYKTLGAYKAYRKDNPYPKVEKIESIPVEGKGYWIYPAYC